ncbi:piggyBac transposable element-derived protein 4-like [Stegodyphus dumicola]|uniref:piggyBac transposable element-derived protein 4-like n=1 Tax=Stegodyphus dumicola TaxID=202533 RepID=UPI0015A9A1BE|nr:piggyBac transposable element-derived protein 4-like [Stegodyphus dumicola]
MLLLLLFMQEEHMVAMIWIMIFCGIIHGVFLFLRETMSRNRFRDIMKYLRFDLKSTRTQRLESDKFALFSDIWNKFIRNCAISYKPGENLVVDEQLFPSKARCKFIQYMPNKPDKLGIKIWMLVDVDSKYMCNAFRYLGKNTSRSETESLPENVVMRLLSHYLNSGRNLTTDNYFSSLSLARRLKMKNTSFFGTVRRHRQEIPHEVRKSKTRLFEIVLLKNGETTLTVYQGKRNKNVLLLSTLHPSVNIDSQNKKKLPETVEFYNKTKYGVDIVDKMTRKYSVRAVSRRWPVHVFYNMLDLTRTNAYIIYDKLSGKNNARHDFLFQLAEELRELYLNRRKTAKLPQEISKSSNRLSKNRHQCQIGLCSNNKTSDVCKKCSYYVCGKCTSNIEKVAFCKNCEKL